MELKGFDDFVIHASDPDFKATGLSCDSFIMGNPITHVPLLVFKEAKYKGVISGELKKGSSPF